MATTIPLPVRLVAALPMVWRHFCGALNEGHFSEGDVCSGCNTDAKPNSVEARYLLVELEGG